MLLHMCTFGLNFCDVFNVLGEYSCDSRPPGTDATGVVAEYETSACLAVGDTAFCLGRTPLLARKPAALSF